MPAAAPATVAHDAAAEAVGLLERRLVEREVLADVVDVATEPVAGAVHVELAVRGRLDHRVDVADLRAVEQAAVEHALREHADRGLVGIALARAGPVAAIAARCAASTISYSSRCGALKRPSAGRCA
jgi:hypothetical protein